MVLTLDYNRETGSETFYKRRETAAIRPEHTLYKISKQKIHALFMKWSSVLDKKAKPNQSPEVASRYLFRLGYRFKTVLWTASSNLLHHYLNIRKITPEWFVKYLESIFMCLLHDCWTEQTVILSHKHNILKWQSLRL